MVRIQPEFRVNFLDFLADFPVSYSCVTHVSYKRRYGGTMPEFVAAVDGVAEKMYQIFLDFAFKTMQNAVEKRTGLQFVAGNSTSNANNSTSSAPNTPFPSNSGFRFTSTVTSGPSSLQWSGSWIIKPLISVRKTGVQLMSLSWRPNLIP